MKYIILLLALVSTSVFADGFYIQTDMSVQRALAPLASSTRNVDGHPMVIDEYRPYDNNATANPYTSIALGYAKDTKVFSLPIEWHVEGYHRSSMSTNKDRGITAFNVGMRVWLR